MWNTGRRGGNVKGRPTNEMIQRKFAKYLESNSATTDSIIKMVALEFDIPQSLVIDAVTKGQPVKKGVRK